MSPQTYGISSRLIDVIIPAPWWHALTYECGIIPEFGARIVVPVGNTVRIGIAIGESKRSLPSYVKRIRRVINIIDEHNLIDEDLFKLAEWSGRESFCGTGSALRGILPVQFFQGAELHERGFEFWGGLENKFTHENFYNPLDGARFDFYIEQLEKNKRCLILFPRHEEAAKFFQALPNNLRLSALLWRDDIWNKWQDVYYGTSRIVIAAPGGIFAPFRPEIIIIDGEADYSCYTLPADPKLSARDLAMKRAEILGAEFITGGRLPSSKIFFNSSPDEILKTEREKIILADINYSTVENIFGIDEDIALTKSLLKHTLECIANDQNVFWILNRHGLASEIFCQECGEILTCKKCGCVLRAEAGGEKLRCPVCGAREILPCENCGSKLFSGRRAGLDSWFEAAKKYFPNVKLYENKKLNLKKSALILGTSAILNLCENLKPGLIAWLNIDSELSRPDYRTRFDVFNNLWSSYWRGRNKNSDRKVLIQARSKGIKFAEILLSGFKRFWQDELSTRKDLDLPPYTSSFKIKCPVRFKDRIIKKLESENFFVMDSGEDDDPIWINTDRIDELREILRPLFEIKYIMNAPEIEIFRE